LQCSNAKIFLIQFHINWNTDTHFVITEYRIKFSHDFDWEKRQNFSQGEIFKQKIDFGNGIYTHAKELGLNFNVQISLFSNLLRY